MCQPRVIVKMIVEKQMKCRLAGETEVLGENLPQRHFCPSQNPTWPDPGLNPGRRGGKPATNRLSYGEAEHTDLSEELLPQPQPWRADTGPLFSPSPLRLLNVAPQAEGSLPLYIRVAPYSQATRATCKSCKLHTLLTVPHSPISRPSSVVNTFGPPREYTAHGEGPCVF
jgi:hypothetical protein